MKVHATIAAVSFATASGLCCYEGCAKAPTSCNPAGEWCSSEANCGTCGGTWCSDGPTPTPTPPTPSPPTPSPTPPSGDLVEYCPDPATDFQEERESGAQGTVTWTDGGWSIQGWLRVSSKASFDFSGGGMTWGMDLIGAHGSVNNNLYITYPGGDGNPGISNYCDSGGSAGIRGCAEMDWTENNGNCWQATTWHDDTGGGDHGGYGGQGGISGNIDCSVQYSDDGSSVNINIGGNHYDGNGQTGEMKSKGAVIYSSQWTGWVPGDCGGGDRDSSVYKMNNMKITAKVVSGPEPRRCHPLPPSPPPPPSPSPSSSCTGADDGADLQTCVSNCPSDTFADCVSCCSDKFPSAEVV